MLKNASNNLYRQIVLIISAVVLEYYQFTLFMILATPIERDLLPLADHAWQHWFGLSIFVLAGFCRPLGGIIYALVRDRTNRSVFFVHALLGLSVISLVMGFLPTANTIGILALLILILARIFQGMILGAAVPEAIIYFYENTAPQFRVLTTNLVNFSISIGFLLAIVFSVISNSFFSYESWRVGLVLCGIVNLIVALRFGRVSKRRASTQLISQIRPDWQFIRLFTNYKLVLLRLIGFATFLTSGLAVFYYVLPSYLYEYFHYPRWQIHLNGACVVVGFVIGLGLAIFYHENLNKNFYLSLSFIMKILLVFVFHTYLRHNLFETIILNAICSCLFGFFMAKLPILIVSSFPPELRYAGVSLIYNLSFGVISGFSHYGVRWLIHITKSLYSPSMYIIFFSYISLICLWFMSKESFYVYREDS